MTAAQLILNLQKTALVGLKIGDTTDANNTTLLLELLNMAKNKIAEDTLLWLQGETIVQLTGTYEYTLTRTPVQIIDVFDKNNILRPRNSTEFFGYFQLSPKVLKFNNIVNGLEVYVNYYDTPDDYLINDTIVVPATLLSAMQYYMAHKSYESYKGEQEIFTSKEYMSKYVNAIKDFRSTTDSLDVDSVVSTENKVWLRGIK